MPPKTSDWPMRVLLIVLAAVILFMLISYYGTKSKTEASVDEKFVESSSPAPAMYTTAMSAPVASTDSMAAPATAAATGASASTVMPSEPITNEDYLAVDYNNGATDAAAGSCYPKDKPLTAEDLLPKDAANSSWSQVNPAGQGALKDVHLLNAGYHMGVNTVGQSLRNPNLQIRSEPPNPKVKVSPWNQATIEYDSSRRFFELGEC